MLLVSNPNSIENTILKQPNIRHHICSQVEEIFIRESVDDNTLRTQSLAFPTCHLTSKLMFNNFKEFNVYQTSL